MIYDYQEQGVTPGSEVFFSTPSKLAESVLFYLYRCGRYLLTTEYSITRKNFNSYLIFYIEKGSLQIENEGKNYLAHSGDICIINCHLPHSYRANEEGTILDWLHFDGSNTAKFYRHILDRHKAVFPIGEQSSIYQDIQWLLQCNRQAEKESRHLLAEDLISSRIHHMLASMLFAISDSSGVLNSSRNPSIEKAISYIQEHYGEAIGVNDIAAAVNLSRFHFTRLFKAELGYSPHEYLSTVRMNRAKELLKSSNYSIAEIAQMVGYEYTSSFSTVFQNKIGVTPKKYRDIRI